MEEWGLIYLCVKELVFVNLFIKILKEKTWKFFWQPNLVVYFFNIAVEIKNMCHSAVDKENIPHRVVITG